jgi:hypothetical protein
MTFDEPLAANTLTLQAAPASMSPQEIMLSMQRQLQQMLEMQTKMAPEGSPLATVQ